MIVLRWLISLLLLFLGGWITLANWIIPARPKGGSLIPVLGGLFGAVAFATIPIIALNSFWWLPLIVDLGCLPLLVMTGSYLAWQAYRKRDEDQQS